METPVTPSQLGRQDPARKGRYSPVFCLSVLVLRCVSGRARDVPGRSDGIE